ncbi:NAD(P)/FAD-dependent oxidoreductase [Altericroceibacterium xinjiangense]|uniref:NAD(P)/FAD-dependent oxidoreductase n=1 Tax=Altericroceibacterium xinjiangense TaxID=762261 RepID=UPI000F7F5A98|nr:FAD-dependent monooxygenase [Altericroceibacterium xinjiangense]
MTPLVLGAGPAGCAAAITLAHAGARPLLIDRDRHVGDPLCGGFLSWRTADRLARLGVDCAALGAEKVDRLVLFAGYARAEIVLPAPAFGLSRNALDRALRQRAQEAGVRFAFDTVRTVESTRAIGQEREWESDGLFLATGKHNVRGAGRDRQSSDPALGLRVRLPASSRLSRLVGGTIELHLFRGGYAGIMLQEDGSANVCLALRKSRLSDAGRDPSALLADLARRHPHFADRLGEDWQDARIDTIGAVPYGWIARGTEPGVFRLGDQAAVIPSLAGEGIDIALASGTLAAGFWLRSGSAAAPSFQRTFAARARRPLMAAAAAWSLAECPSRSRIAVAATRLAPGLLRTVMQRTRIV